MVKWQWRQRGSRGSHANLGPHPLHSPAGTGCNFLLPLLLRKTQKDKVGVRMRPLCCYPWLCFHLEKKRNSFTKPGPFTIYWHHITHGAPAPGVSVVPHWAQHSSIPESLSWPPSQAPQATSSPGARRLVGLQHIRFCVCPGKSWWMNHSHTLKPPAPWCFCCLVLWVSKFPPLLKLV